MTLPFTLQIDNKPNYFIEKIWQGLVETRISNTEAYSEYQIAFKELFGYAWQEDRQFPSKLYTIRSGERWSVGNAIQFATEAANGEMFNFAPELTCISIQSLEMEYSPTLSLIIDGNRIDVETMNKLSINDGFDDLVAFKSYFNNRFIGQIVHWTDFRYHV